MAKPEQPLCRLDDIADGGALAVTMDGDEPGELVLLRHGEKVFAYPNVCSHQARRLDYAPGKFLVSKGCLVCPVHGSSFDIETGECRGGPAPSGLKAVPVRVAEGAVWLDDQA